MRTPQARQRSVNRASRSTPVILRSRITNGINFTRNHAHLGRLISNSHFRRLLGENFSHRDDLSKHMHVASIGVEPPKVHVLEVNGVSKLIAATFTKP